MFYFVTNISMSFESFRNYALNYYLRYYPSIKKFREKLYNKSWGDEKLVTEVIDSIESIIVEKQVIESKIRLYISRNKNLNYIKSKLFEKWFEKEMYEEILNNNYNLDETLLDREYIKRKVFDYKEKWKSKKYIFGQLFWRREDKDLIESVLDEVYWEEKEIDAVIIEYEKLKWKCEWKKIIEKLLRKGFRYEDVKNVINCD